MKKIPLIIILLFVSKWGLCANWQPVKSGSPSPAKISLISSTITTSVVHLSLPGFSFTDVSTARGTQQLIDLPGGFPLYEKGQPDLQRVPFSVIIPNSGSSTVNILSSKYVDYENVEIAPSKGIIYYCQNPDQLDFEYGDAYQKNAFFPSSIATLRDPHIMRTVRGIDGDIYPFQYNPVTKTLRVYSDITLEVKTNVNERGANSLDATPTSSPAVFNEMYESYYLNYAEFSKANRAAIPMDNPNGRMLVICYDNFSADIQPFVDWKILKGIQTEVVLVSKIGTTSAVIKKYVDDYYNRNADLTYLVFVGDHAQIPSIVSGDASDTKYAQITGSDVNPEIIVGRLSAETATDVQTQVKKVLMYEKTPTRMAVDRFSTSATISLKIGPDNKTPVYLDMRAVETILQPAGYKTTELFEASLGDLAPTAANITSTVNAGQGFMSWISHGMPSGLASFPFTNSTVKSLTNTSMWPMIWCCSCQTGNFTKTTCFAESLLRANSGGSPTGAIAAAMSTHDMPMGPSEQYGKDAAARLIDNSRKNKTFGGITYDTYLKVAVKDHRMPIEYTTMVIFGDPSLVLRSKAPQVLNVTHKTTEAVGVTSVTVKSATEGAFVALTSNNKILGTAYIAGGTATVTIPAAVDKDIISVTATAFDYAPYFGQVTINDNSSTGVDLANESSFAVYPNPNAGLFNVSFNVETKAAYTLEVKNTLGQLIYQEKLADFAGQYSKQLNVATYGKGIYLISLKNETNEAVKKLVVY